MPGRYNAIHRIRYFDIGVIEALLVNNSQR